MAEVFLAPVHKGVVMDLDWVGKLPKSHHTNPGGRGAAVDIV